MNKWVFSPSLRKMSKSPGEETLTYPAPAHTLAFEIRSLGKWTYDMVENIQQRSGIKLYLMKLSTELSSRLGKRRFYSAEQVTQVVRRTGFSRDYLPCAHALFCQRKDFRRYYKRSEFREHYEILRDNISRQCFGGVRDFDAANIIDAVRSLEVRRGFVGHQTRPVKKRAPVLLGLLAAAIPAIWICVFKFGRVPDFIKANLEGPIERIGRLTFPESHATALAMTYGLPLVYCAVFGVFVGCTCGIILRRHRG